MPGSPGGVKAVFFTGERQCGRNPAPVFGFPEQNPAAFPLLSLRGAVRIADAGVSLRRRKKGLLSWIFPCSRQDLAVK